MSDLARIEIDRDIADVAAQRAAKEGLTVAAYLSLLLRRTFERALDEESVLVYDHVDDGADARIDREPDESEDSHNRRSELYDNLFGQRD